MTTTMLPDRVYSTVAAATSTSTTQSVQDAGFLLASPNCLGLVALTVPTGVEVTTIVGTFQVAGTWFRLYRLEPGATGYGMEIWCGWGFPDTTQAISPTVTATYSVTHTKRFFRIGLYRFSTPQTVQPTVLGGVGVTANTSLLDPGATLTPAVNDLLVTAFFADQNSAPTGYNHTGGFFSTLGGYNNASSPVYSFGISLRRATSAVPHKLTVPYSTASNSAIVLAGLTPQHNPTPVASHTYKGRDGKMLDLVGAP